MHTDSPVFRYLPSLLPSHTSSFAGSITPKPTHLHQHDSTRPGTLLASQIWEEDKENWWTWKQGIQPKGDHSKYREASQT